jgi:hypothetical protein
MMLLALTEHGRVLASGDSDFGAGFIGFMVVVVLGVVCFFLFKSMTRHMRKVPASFDTPPAETDQK